MYVPNRKYVKCYNKKGKSSRGLPYRRETRDQNCVPNSRKQLLKFVKDQNRELHNFIKETTEKKKQWGSLSDVFLEDEGPLETVSDLEGNNLEDSDSDSDEELLEIIENS